MDMIIKKIDSSELNDCLNMIQITYKDRNKRLGFNDFEGHAKITIEELKEMYENNILMYAYYLKDKIIGFISFKIEESYIKIKDLVVLPEYQKGGIGTSLINFAKEYLENNNKKILKLGMIYENKELLNWYQKQGFVITDIIEYPNAVLKNAKMEYRKEDIMNYKDLADLLYPNITKTIDDLEKMYPKRDLKEGAEVCRFAPSPTGRVHIGNLYASFIPEVIANQTEGVFMLRIEDTDQKRTIENGVKLIIDDLEHYNYIVDEHPIKGGKYGPYIQTERKEIYHIVAKYLVSIGRAYPCFCSEDDLSKMREEQESIKDRIGYYGKYAKCRNLSYDEVKKRIDNGDKWVLRLKSMGDFNKKIIFKDLIKGLIQLPENDIDQVLIKSDGIPPYALAHVCDDHFMRVTTVTRDDSYISSVPYHLELWDACGFKAPKFAHILPLNVKEGTTIRKISKRKDPEAAISFYHEKGIPVEAIKLYLATIMNSNFEGWFLQNPNESYRNFKFSFDKMSKSGPLFDLEKVINISKNYLSRLSANEVYDNLLEWSLEFDKEFYNLITEYKDYTINILNIERVQKKPRKDFSCCSEIKNYIWYMYDELFNNLNYEWQNINDLNEIKNILNIYINKYYDETDDKETWFNKIKLLCDELRYASDMKDYKDNIDKYKGSVADISNVIRIALTTKSTTPDLYEIMKLLGEERINKRINNI